MPTPQYKPLLFTTTMRNPGRIKHMLFVLSKFEGHNLTNELATTIVAECIRYGLYRPNKKPESVKAKWRTTTKGSFSKQLLTDGEVQELMRNNPQKHKEAGFEYGFPSRFATLYDLCKELGFAYFCVGEPIVISRLGRRLIDVLKVDEDGDKLEVYEVHPEYETEVFMQAFAKSQRKNPFVRVLNDNVPLVLLLETIKLLNADSDFNGTGISRRELPLLIFWKNNDAHALYKRIRTLRLTYGYNPSDEVILDICIDEIMEGNYKQFKPESIMSDYTDEFIRKMRMTGLISLRGAGRFVDINHNEDKKIDYILGKYSTYPKFTDEKAYFDYMATMDKNLFAIKTIQVSAKRSEELLKNWLSVYQWETIKAELINLSKKHTSKDNILRILAAPIRLEFLTSLAIMSKLPQVRVIPNYVADDTGLPTSTAGGDKGDIECFEDDKGILVEVTMLVGREQTVREVWPIKRHLIEFKEKYSTDSQCAFVAPSIFSDSQDQIDYVSYRSSGEIKIIPYKIVDFLKYLETTKQLYSSD